MLYKVQGRLRLILHKTSHEHDKWRGFVKFYGATTRVCVGMALPLDVQLTQYRCAPKNITSWPDRWGGGGHRSSVTPRQPGRTATGFVLFFNCNLQHISKTWLQQPEMFRLKVGGIKYKRLSIESSYITRQQPIPYAALYILILACTCVFTQMSFWWY